VPLDKGIEAFDQLGVRNAVFGRKQSGGGNDRMMGRVGVSHRDRLGLAQRAGKTDVMGTAVADSTAKR
jgi:hypothetical protein